jgi:hypothetical protein
MLKTWLWKNILNVPLCCCLWTFMKFMMETKSRSLKTNDCCRTIRESGLFL